MIRRDKLLGLMFTFIGLMGMLLIIYLFMSISAHIMLKVPLLLLLPPTCIILIVGLKLIIYEPINKVSAETLLKRHVSKTRPTCVSLSGVDGSGKSTQIHMLSKVMRTLGFRVKIYWMRWPAFVSYPLLLLAKLMGYSARRGNYVEHRYYLNKALARVIVTSLILDYVVRYSCLKLLQRLFNVHLLLDRNILDLVVDLYEWTRDSFLFSPTLIRLYRGLLRDCWVIILDVEEKEALKRKKDIPNISYLRIRRKIYHGFSKYLGFYIVNTTESKPRITFLSLLNRLRLQSLLELYKLYKR
uniref:Thymidylate kinase-like domain-containing protein n=1 Tax=Ignisphaera aggregans TaxID=334771 RepID=A0A7J3YTH3_9CREN